MFEGLTHRTRKRLKPDQTKLKKLNWTSCGSVFLKKKTNEEPLQTGPIKTSCNWFKMAIDTPCKYALFAPIFKRNSAELHVLQPKQYVTSEYDFVQHLILVFFELYKIIITINYL